MNSQQSKQNILIQDSNLAGYFFRIMLNMILFMYLQKNEINHFKCFITMIRFPPNSPTYVVFVNTRSSWTSDVVIFKRYCRQGTIQSRTWRWWCQLSATMMWSEKSVHLPLGSNFFSPSICSLCFPSSILNIYVIN